MLASTVLQTQYTVWLSIHAYSRVFQSCSLVLRFQVSRFQSPLYTVFRKKGDTILTLISLSNLNRFSIFVLTDSPVNLQ